MLSRGTADVDPPPGKAVRVLARGRPGAGHTVASVLGFTCAAIAVAVAVWALWERWRAEQPMPMERPVVVDPIVHIPRAGLIVWVMAGSDEDLVPVVEALHRGGVTAVALQATTPAPSQALGRLRAAFARRVLIGAAGVRTVEEAREAVRAGAEFVLMTGAEPEVIQVCRDARALAIPGAFTPTEIRQAWNLGTGLLALFPTGHLGPEYVRDVLRTMPEVAAVVSGGITPENAGAFIRAGAAAVVATDEPDASDARDHDARTRRAQALVQAIDRARARSVRPSLPVRPLEGPDVR